MKITSPTSRRKLKGVLFVAAASAALLVTGLSQAQRSNDSSGFVPLQTSINAVMVDLVDHAAHFIWESSYADTLTGKDWQIVEQHAIQLVASGTLISIPGTGPADRGWTTSPAWQEWAQKLTDAGLSALAAVDKTDQKALEAAGDSLVQTCEGCHAVFKPDVPTEGILHIPHYDE